MWSTYTWTRNKQLWELKAKTGATVSVLSAGRKKKEGGIRAGGEETETEALNLASCNIPGKNNPASPHACCQKRTIFAWKDDAICFMEPDTCGEAAERLLR